MICKRRRKKIKFANSYPCHPFKILPETKLYVFNTYFLAMNRTISILKAAFAKFNFEKILYFFFKTPTFLGSIFAFSLLLAGFTNPLSAQILPFSVKIKTQAGIQQLIDQYAPFTGIEGDLTIGFDDYYGTNYSNITDLSPLACLKTVGGDLIVTRNPHLKTLYGLHNIDSISIVTGYRGLIISQNDSLENLEGLNSVSYLDGNVIIDSCNNFISFKGLEKLRRTDGLDLYKCHKIKKIIGLDSLKFIRQEVYADNNYQAFYGGNIHIYQNENLEDISNIQHVHCWSGTKIAIISNNKLVEIPQIDIDSIDWINIENNIALKKIAIDQSIYIRNATILNNPILDTISFANTAKIGEPNMVVSPSDNIELINNKELRWLNFKNVKIVEGNITIKKNLNLHNIGFEKLEKVKHDFTIYNNGLTPNNALTTLDGLENLKSVGRYFEILYMDSLKSLNNFDSLSYVGTILSIAGNNLLESVGGITHLDSMGKYGFVGFGSPKLTGNIIFPDLATDISFGTSYNSADSVEFSKVNNVRSIGITGNPGLKSVKFPALYDKNSVLKKGTIARIYDNPQLQTLDGIRGWSYVQDSIVINNNPLLTDCDAICQMLENGMPESKIRIKNNIFPCNGLNEIKNNVCQFYVQTNEPTSTDKIGISFFPNPASEFITIESPADKLPATLQIYSNQGALLKTKKLYQTSAQVEITDFKSGFYWLFIPELHAWAKLVVAN
jgi:Secretion system C-terminal sorting domain